MVGSLFGWNSLDTWERRYSDVVRSEAATHESQDYGGLSNGSFAWVWEMKRVEDARGKKETHRGGRA